MKVRIIFTSAFFYLIYLGIAFGFSGCLERDYEVLQESQTVAIQSINYTTKDIARRYSPQIWSPSNYQNENPLMLYYEVIETDEVVSIVYHPVWEDETVPNPIYNALYKLFRFINYGLTLKDIEYIQVDVNKKLGKLSRAIMETKHPTHNYNTVFQEHLQLELKQLNGNLFNKLIYNAEGEIIENSEVELATPNLVLQIASWNHLLDTFSTDDNKSLFNQQKFSLAYLTDTKYKRLKFARRSQGDYKTLESPMNIPIIFFVGILPLFYFFVIISDYAKNKNKFPRDLEKEGEPNP